MSGGDLAAFIADRYQEAEALAKDAPYELDENWFSLPSEHGPAGAVEYYTRHSPAHRQRDLALKRAILTLHAPDEDRPYRCRTCHDPAAADYPCPTVRQLGTEFTEHAGYKESWKP